MIFSAVTSELSRLSSLIELKSLNFIADVQQIKNDFETIQKILVIENPSVKATASSRPRARQHKLDQAEQARKAAGPIDNLLRDRLVRENFTLRFRSAIGDALQIATNEQTRRSAATGEILDNNNK
jgi:hypothetical protein